MPTMIQYFDSSGWVGHSEILNGLLNCESLNGFLASVSSRSPPSSVSQFNGSIIGRRMAWFWVDCDADLQVCGSTTVDRVIYHSGQWLTVSRKNQLSPSVSEWVFPLINSERLRRSQGVTFGEASSTLKSDFDSEKKKVKQKIKLYSSVYSFSDLIDWCPRSSSGHSFYSNMRADEWTLHPMSSCVLYLLLCLFSA